MSIYESSPEAELVDVIVRRDWDGGNTWSGFSYDGETFFIQDDQSLCD